MLYKALSTTQTCLKECIAVWSVATMKEKKGTTEDGVVGWHHQLDAHEFEQAPGVGDGQGGKKSISLMV